MGTKTPPLTDHRIFVSDYVETTQRHAPIRVVDLGQVVDRARLVIVEEQHLMYGESVQWLGTRLCF